MKIYVSFRITEERSNLLITDALERGGGFADGVHLDWKEKSTLQMNTDKTFTLVRKKSQNKKTDQGGAVGAGVGRGQGDQGRDQDHVQTHFSLTLSMKESAFLSHRCASGKTLYEKGLMMIFPDRGS